LGEGFTCPLNRGTARALVGDAGAPWGVVSLAGGSADGWSSGGGVSLMRSPGGRVLVFPVSHWSEWSEEAL
jgi:hypothetical protein